jgi:hypothetical protein
VDEFWDAFLDVALPLGPLYEKRSRFALKPAVYLDGREIAHAEGAGCIDLRITRKAWGGLVGEWRNDPAVGIRARASDWIELTPRSPKEVARLAPLIVAAVAANQSMAP